MSAAVWVPLSAGPGHAGGRAEDERARWNFRALGHQRPGAHDGLIADDGPVQDDRAHADEHFVAHGAGVNHRGVAHGNVVANDAGIVVGQMDHGVVLDVGMVAHHDAVDVAAQDGVVPHAGEILERHVAEHGGALGDVHIAAQLWFPAEESFELLFQSRHGVCHCTSRR